MVLEPDAAGIDIGAEEIYVAVPPDQDEASTRRFSSFTRDLHASHRGNKGVLLQALNLSSWICAS